MSPSKAIVWDWDEPPTGDSFDLSPNPLWLHPAELAPAERLAGCIQPEHAVHASPTPLPTMGASGLRRGTW